MRPLEDVGRIVLAGGCAYRSTASIVMTPRGARVEVQVDNAQRHFYDAPEQLRFEVARDAFDSFINALHAAVQDPSMGTISTRDEVIELSLPLTGGSLQHVVREREGVPPVDPLIELITAFVQRGALEAPAEAPPDPYGFRARQVRLYLLCRGERHEVDQQEFKIGRAKDCGLAIPDGSLSRRHAQIVYRHGSYTIEDLNSTNGVKWLREAGPREAESAWLRIERPRSIASGDCFRLGNIEIVCRFDEVADDLDPVGGPYR